MSYFQLPNIPYNDKLIDHLHLITSRECKTNIPIVHEKIQEICTPNFYKMQKAKNYKLFMQFVQVWSTPKYAFLRN